MHRFKHLSPKIEKQWMNDGYVEMQCFKIAFTVNLWTLNVQFGYTWIVAFVVVLVVILISKQ